MSETELLISRRATTLRTIYEVTCVRDYSVIISQKREGSKARKGGKKEKIPLLLFFAS